MKLFRSLVAYWHAVQRRRHDRQILERDAQLYPHGRLV
jgi:hypothetical protein